MKTKPKFKDLTVSQIKAINKLRKERFEMIHGKGLTESQYQRHTLLEERIKVILEE